MSQPSRHPPLAHFGAAKSPNPPTPRNVDSSGALVTANAENGVAIFTGYDLRAGSIRSGKVMIVNAGSLSGRFKVLEVDASNSFSEGDLTMVIDEISGEQPVDVYRGDIGGMPYGGIDLGAFEPGEFRTYRFLVVLAIDSPNGGQGRGAGAVYEWDFVPYDLPPQRAA